MYHVFIDSMFHGHKIVDLILLVVLAEDSGYVCIDVWCMGVYDRLLLCFINELLLGANDF
jgi:hypothetical protein